MKKKIECFLITVFITIFIIAGIGVAVEKGENEKRRIRHEYVWRKMPKLLLYW